MAAWQQEELAGQYIGARTADGEIGLSPPADYTTAKFSFDSAILQKYARPSTIEKSATSCSRPSAKSRG